MHGLIQYGRGGQTDTVLLVAPIEIILKGDYQCTFSGTNGLLATIKIETDPEGEEKIVVGVGMEHSVSV